LKIHPVSYHPATLASIKAQQDHVVSRGRKKYRQIAGIVTVFLAVSDFDHGLDTAKLAHNPLAVARYRVGYFKLFPGTSAMLKDALND